METMIEFIKKYWIPVILGTVMIVSGINLGFSIYSYKVANSEYDALKEYVVETDAKLDSSVEDTKNSTDELEGNGNAVENEPIFDVPEINFVALKEINEDFKGWLMVPALDISYPFVQGKDNEEYLHKTFDGTPNRSGAIFMDGYNYPNFVDYNTLIYGHNMKDQSMFGSLKTITKDENLLKDDNHIYVFTSDKSYQYEIFAYYVTYKKSKTYQILNNTKEYDEYIEYIDSVSEMENPPKIDMSEHPRILTLSTCYGAAGTSNRYVVHAVLVNTIENNS